MRRHLGVTTFGVAGLLAGSLWVSVAVAGVPLVGPDDYRPVSTSAPSRLANHAVTAPRADPGLAMVDVVPVAARIVEDEPEGQAGVTLQQTISLTIVP